VTIIIRYRAVIIYGRVKITSVVRLFMAVIIIKHKLHEIRIFYNNITVCEFVSKSVYILQQLTESLQSL